LKIHDRFAEHKNSKKQLHVPQERKMVRGDNIRLICKQQQLPCNLISLANVSHYGPLNARCRKCTNVLQVLIAS